MAYNPSASLLSPNAVELFFDPCDLEWMTSGRARPSQEDGEMQLVDDSHLTIEHGGSLDHFEEGQWSRAVAESSLNPVRHASSSLYETSNIEFMEQEVLHPTITLERFTVIPRRNAPRVFTSRPAVETSAVTQRAGGAGGSGSQTLLRRVIELHRRMIPTGKCGDERIETCWKDVEKLLKLRMSHQMGKSSCFRIRKSNESDRVVWPLHLGDSKSPGLSARVTRRNIRDAGSKRTSIMYTLRCGTAGQAVLVLAGTPEPERVHSAIFDATSTYELSGMRYPVDFRSRGYEVVEEDCSIATAIPDRASDRWSLRLGSTLTGAIQPL